MKLRHVGTFVLAFCLAVCVPASAFAGNGNGKDKDAGNGNSANAPGQVKKEEAAAAAAAEQTAQSQVTTTAVVEQSAADVAQTGVKPSNDTDKDTHAQAASDKTKQYGNGKTAGQIAMQNGAAPTTTLHGPGNSQPHKASPCAGGHEVDVHALKGKRNGSCGSSHPTPTPQPNPVPDPGPKPKDPVPPVPSSPTPSTPAVTQPATVGGVVVTPARPPSKEHRGSGKGSVLGSTGAVAAKTTLPFTGVDLWSAVFVGVMLILIGLALCRRAATIPVYESDQEARP
jgi:hypothetical protein